MSRPFRDQWGKPPKKSGKSWKRRKTPKRTNSEFGEGVESAMGVAAIVVCRRNSSCNGSCDAIARNGRRTIAFFLLFRVQWFVCKRLCEGMFQTSFECGCCGQVLQSHLRYFRTPCDRDPPTGNFNDFKFFKTSLKIINVNFWGKNV